MTTALAPVLAPAALYLGDNGRIMCTDCAGASARFTGRDLSGHPVSAVTPADVDEWPTFALGAMTCECGRVTA